MQLLNKTKQSFHDVHVWTNQIDQTQITKQNKSIEQKSYVLIHTDNVDSLTRTLTKPNMKTEDLSSSCGYASSAWDLSRLPWFCSVNKYITCASLLSMLLSSVGAYKAALREAETDLLLF